MVQFSKRTYFLWGSAATLLLLALTLPAIKTEPILRVAFIGNSVTFVNDLPRFVEALGHKRIVQDSCLHGSLSFATILVKGNGMTHKWSTKKAKMSNGLYDFGACSVPQLLQGYDADLEASAYQDDQNNNNMYNDGRNPCSLDAAYLEYRESLYTGDPWTWDFVVMNDQSRYPLSYQRRERSLAALQETYVPLLQAAQATAVLMVTYGYVAQAPITDDDASAWRYTPTETEDDMPHFSSALYYGYQEYQELLEENGVEVRLAPVGLAFLTVWEEDRDLWRQLFFVDGLHPSPLGTYLQGCVIYATIRRRLPPVPIRIERVSQLWKRARRMNIGRSWYSSFLTDEEAAEVIPMDLPTREEAHVLSDVCQRVALEGYLPYSLLSKDELNEGVNDDDAQFFDDDNARFAAAEDDDDNR